jgi:hypothetical protein
MSQPCISRFVFALIIVPLFLIEAQGQTVRSLRFPIFLEGKGGYIDEKGRMMIPPSFDGAEEFSEGLAAVRSGAKWGYISESGAVDIPFRFDWAGKFSEGMAAIFVDGKYGFIDRAGKLKIPPGFSKVGDFHEGLARVKVNGNWGYINQNGKIVIPATYDYADHFHEGFAVIAEIGADNNIKVGYINKLGERMFKEWFISASRFSGGVAVVSHDAANGFTSGYYDDLVFDNYDEQTGAQKLVNFEVIDTKGKKIFAGRFQDLDVFCDGLAVVRLNDKYGFINSRGEMVIPPKFESARRFSGGIAFAYADGKRFYINQEGNTVFDINYSDSFPASRLVFIQDCSDHLLPCKGGYLNKNGEIVWTPTR